MISIAKPQYIYIANDGTIGIMEWQNKDTENSIIGSLMMEIARHFGIIKYQSKELRTGFILASSLHLILVRPRDKELGNVTHQATFVPACKDVSQQQIIDSNINININYY